MEELQEKLEGNNNFEEVIQNYKKLKERNQENLALIEKLQEEKSELSLKNQELESNIQSEELREKELEKQIEILNENIKELEEKFSKERIEGKAHIGLSKIDFIQNNLGVSKLSIGKSYFRRISSRRSKMPSMMPEVIPEDESVVLEKSQIMLVPPSKMEQRYSMRSSMRSKINSNFPLKFFKS